MTDPTALVEQWLEKVARALCELHIRHVRRFDTEPKALEAMLPEAVAYSWADFTDAARAAILTLAPEIEAKQWQPIETAPTDGAEVLLFIPDFARWTDNPRILCGRYDGHRWTDNGAAAVMVGGEPTHWMPLPTPPTLSKGTAHGQ